MRVVVIVLAVIGAAVLVVGGVLFWSVKDLPKASVKEAERDVRLMQDEIDTFALKYRRLPDSLEDAVPTDRDGHLHLQDTDPGHLALGHRPMDPWGRVYRYEVQGTTYTVRSMGPDGQDNTADDIARTATYKP